MDKDNIEHALKKAENYLLSLRGENLWGESSSSPYSTAWALCAFLYSYPEKAKETVEWLLSHQNPDGSWGSAFRYHERFVFTPYCLNALLFYEKTQKKVPRLDRAVRKARQFIQTSTQILGTLDSFVEEIYSRIYPALWLARENQIPYLSRFEKFGTQPLAIDVLPEPSGICDEMLSLNFVLPHIAESKDKYLVQQLETKQLPNGSWYCCVIDLTAFALIVLQLTDGDPQCIQKGYTYLKRSQNPDRGFPQFFPCEVFISTYVGFLITEVYTRTGVPVPLWISQCAEWIMKTQNPTGSWSFSSEYPFGDIDDTAWAMLWLLKGCKSYNASIEAGRKFILSNQNADGGFPAWPHLKSDTDLTAHALLILEVLGESQKKKDIIFEYLAKTQQKEGSWVPRWHHSTFYGTTQVVLGLTSYRRTDVYEKALNYLVKMQQEDGNWGTAEETGLVLSTLLTLPEAKDYTDYIKKGVAYLVSTQNTEGFWDYKDLWIAQCSYSSRPLAITPIVAALKAYSRLFL